MVFQNFYKEIEREEMYIRYVCITLVCMLIINNNVCCMLTNAEKCVIATEVYFVENCETYKVVWWSSQIHSQPLHSPRAALVLSRLVLSSWWSPLVNSEAKLLIIVSQRFVPVDQLLWPFCKKISTYVLMFHSKLYDPVRNPVITLPDIGEL